MRRAAWAQQPADTAAPSATPLTNEDVIGLVKAGMSVEIITATIESSATQFDVSPTALQDLKAAGVSDPIILAMIKAAKPAPRPRETRLKDELTTLFQRLQYTVVTVWSEFSHGSGFIISEDGLIVTNQHVVGPSEYLAVQFDQQRKIPAVLLAARPEKDVAVLWADLSLIPEAQVASLADTASGQPAVVEGERVLTIGSPLNQRKIMTTGIVSKVEERALISDININPGNSGGPLFNSLGEVVGITTFGEPPAGVGPGVSGIVRIEEALEVIAAARARMREVSKPSARLLLVEPTDPFPPDALKAAAMNERFDYKRYAFNLGDYQVTLFTPPLLKWLEMAPARQAAKTKEKRTNKAGAVQGTYRPFDEFYAWREYVGDYKPVLMVRATPELGESFWGALGRGMAASYGVVTPARLRFKADFYRMRLLCGTKEVEPIHPGKIAHLLSESNAFVSIHDATFEGLYVYPADAITTACGPVHLQVYSEKEPHKAHTKTLDPKTVLRVAEDFQPYLQRAGLER